MTGLDVRNVVAWLYPFIIVKHRNTGIVVWINDEAKGARYADGESQFDSGSATPRPPTSAKREGSHPKPLPFGSAPTRRRVAKWLGGKWNMRLSVREILALLDPKTSDKDFIRWLKGKVGFK